MKDSRSAAAAVVALSLFAAACSKNNDYSYAAVTMPEGDPTATINLATGGSITIPEGSAAEAQIVLTANDGNALQGSIVSENPSILKVLAVQDASAYVFLGITAGTTEVEVLVDGKEVQTVPATVEPLPASSAPAQGDGSSPASLDGGS